MDSEHAMPRLMRVPTNFEHELLGNVKRHESQFQGARLQGKNLQLDVPEVPCE